MCSEVCTRKQNLDLSKITSGVTLGLWGYVGIFVVKAIHRLLQSSLSSKIGMLNRYEITIHLSVSSLESGAAVIALTSGRKDCFYMTKHLHIYSLKE